MASSDLGGLGAMNGAPVEYNWMMPGLAPLVVPWLVILGLLAIRSNRRPAAWLIWLPLGCVTAMMLFPTTLLPADADPLWDVVAALAFGLAAVWLLSNHLHRSHRFLTFLCVLFALAGFSGMAFLSREGLSLLTPETVVGCVLLAVGVLVTSVALSLGSLICRTRYRPFGLYPCLLVLLTGSWLLIAVPFFLFALVASGGMITWRSWSEFFVPVLTVSMVNFVILLPFLILSSASRFFRERLKALLNVKPEAPMSLNTLPLDIDLKT